jgi:hypothetical protein
MVAIASERNEGRKRLRAARSVLGMQQHRRAPRPTAISHTHGIEAVAMKKLDQIEYEYERAIAIAAAHGDNDTAYELSIGLQQYRKYYKAQ